jgi:hypothetical protein
VLYRVHSTQLGTHNSVCDTYCICIYSHSRDIEDPVLVLVPNTLSLKDIYITRRGYTIHHILVSVSVQIYTIYRGFAFRKPDPPFQEEYQAFLFSYDLGPPLRPPPCLQV